MDFIASLFSCLVGSQSTKACIEVGSTSRAENIRDLISQGLVVSPLRAVLEKRVSALVAMRSHSPALALSAPERPAHSLFGRSAFYRALFMARAAVHAKAWAVPLLGIDVLLGRW